MNEAGRGYTILVPVSDVTPVGPLIELASALVPVPARPDEGELTTGRVVVLRVLEVPPDLALTAAAAPAQQMRQSLGRLKRLRWPPHVDLRSTVRVSRESWTAVVEAAYEEAADLVLIPWHEWRGDRTRVDSAVPTFFEQVVANAPCDVAVAQPAPVGQVRRVMVPVRGGPHAALALRLAAALGERAGATVTALRVDRPDLGRIERERELAEFSAVLEVAPEQARDHVKSLTVLAPAVDLEDALVTQARNHQFLFMGAAAGAPGSPFVLGPVAEALVQASTGGVVVVRTKLPGTATHEQWAPHFTIAGGDQHERRPTLSEVVDRWFAENTFDSSEFERLDRLVELKRRQGVRISVGLPALNEEETVGAIIRSVKSELCDRYPLIDELVLIDSNSTDRTRAIAEEIGVPVVIHQQVLPEVGTVAGKGEALWKSLHVLTGDIIAWIDTDIRNIHPRFVYGLLGPLLREPRIQYVKGFYKRPIKAGNRIQSTGGGRVTELVARPLLNTFYPELSGLIQPLAGEYAGRRAVLEQLPFFSGYGVEIGLLIDLLERYGLQAIGQVDLKRRVHRNQGLPSLSRMAFTILQVVLRRQAQRGHLEITRELASSMKLIHHDREGFHVEERALLDVERPPIISVGSYWRACRLESERESVRA